VTAAMLDFDEFVSDVADTIARHLATSDAPAAEGEAVAAPRRDAPDPFLLDHERIVWHYPDAASRIMDEVP